MNSDWDNTTLGEEIEFLYGKGLPKRVRQEGDIPVYGSNGIIDYHNEALVKGPGIIIGRKGSVGEIKFSESDFFPIDTTYYLKLKKEGDLVFWYYFLQILGLTKMNTHSAVPGLNREIVYLIPVTIPNPSNQKKIGSFLRSLDEKIEVNTSKNTELEKLGEAFFRRWFVEFEFPDEVGKPYHSNGGPMKQTTKGSIPKKWKIMKIKECGKVITGKTPPTRIKEYYDNDVQFVTIPDMRRQIIITETARKLSKLGANSQKKKELPPLSVCVSCIATPGLVSLTSEISHTNQQINSIICNKNTSPLFMYFYMKEKSNEIVQLGSGGTATLNLNKGNFEKIDLIVPENKMMIEFHKITKPIINSILNNYKENEILENIRDILLPRLMSGKIRLNL